jgi:hypothetical protein
MFGDMCSPTQFEFTHGMWLLFEGSFHLVLTWNVLWMMGLHILFGFTASQASPSSSLQWEVNNSTNAFDDLYQPKDLHENDLHIGSHEIHAIDESIHGCQLLV